MNGYDQNDVTFLVFFFFLLKAVFVWVNGVARIDQICCECVMVGLSAGRGSGGNKSAVQLGKRLVEGRMMDQPSCSPPPSYSPRLSRLLLASIVVLGLSRST